MDAYRHRAAVAAGTSIAFILLVGALALTGAHGRVALRTRRTLAVASPAAAYDTWRQAGVRGRILFLFDRYPHFATGWFDYHAGAPLSDANFVEFAVFENVVRKVLFVVPEAEWDAFEGQPELYRPYREVPGASRAVYLHNASGVPLIAAAPSSLPRPSEEVLVYVNAAVFDPREAEALLTAKGIASDLLVVSGAGAMP
jgi:hypothetical protein